MNMKAFDPISKQWLIIGTARPAELILADSSLFIKNPEAGEPVKFTGSNPPVDGVDYVSAEYAINKNRKDINMLMRDLKFVYENGTIGGGGGGGGGGNFPKLSFAIEGNQVIVKTDNKFSVPFFFSSPNPGDGNAVFTISKRASLDPPVIELKKSIRQGRNTITFDPIPSGDYELTVSATDNLNISAQPIILNIIVGALELTTPDEMSRDVSINDNVVIRYNVVSGIFKENIKLSITDIDGQTTETTVIPGSYTYNIGKIPSLGVKTVRIKAVHDNVESNELVFNFIVTDTANMYVSSTFTGVNEFEEDGQFTDAQTIAINYRISLLGAKYFLTDVYVNGTLHEGDSNIESVVGHNFFPFVPEKYGGIGTYEVTFKCRTLETANPIRGEVTVPSFIVKAATGKTYSYSREGLVLSLDARKGKSNSQTEDKRTVWEDTEPGVVTRTRLHNFSFNHLNGWVPNSDSDPTVEALTFGGKTYAEIDLEPLNNDLKNGFTMEVMFKATDDGHMEANMCNYVLDLFDGEKASTGAITAGKGIFVDVEKAFIRSSYSDSLEVKYCEDEWIKHTFVINRELNEMLIYTNGAISGYAKLDGAANFLTSKKIILGARRGLDNQIKDNATCKIKTLRIYNRVLSDEEVFKNTVADLPIAEQDHLIDIHEGALQIPTVKVKFNMSILQAPADTTQCDFEYFDPRDPSKNQTLYNCIVQKQGTTSTTYPVSNYTITFYNGNQIYEWAPKDNWVPEEIYTLKADFMDSSHINNTGIAKFVSHAFNTIKIDGKNGIKNPAQYVDPRVKDTIDGFMCRVEIYDTSPGAPAGYIYRGLYNFNTDRYGAKNYGLYNPEFRTTAMSYEASSNNAACSFKSKDWNDVKGAFKVRYFKNQATKDYMSFDPDSQEYVMTRGIHKDFERLTAWVYDAGRASIDLDPGSENQFYNEFDEYFDIDYTLMYMLMVETFGLMDNLSKNMVLTMFKEELHTETSSMIMRAFPQLYDLDSSTGLTNTGELRYQPCVNFEQEPGMPPDHVYNGAGQEGSLLWRNVKKHFFAELKRYWAAMRNQGIITLDNLLKYYEGETMDTVSPFLYSLDARLKYITPSQNGSSKDTYYYLIKGRRIEYTRKWLKQRINFLDSIYEYGGGDNDLEGDCRKFIQARYLKNSSSLKSFQVQVKTKSPLFIHHIGDDLKLYGNKRQYVSSDKYYTMNVPIESAGDGAFIGFTFGPHIRDIKFSGADNIQNVRLSYYNLYHAKALTKIDIRNNTALNEIVLENCDSLQHFDVSGCTNLGSVSGKEALNFKNCPNIRYIDFNKTAVGGLVLNPGGGILESLNCNDSKLANFVLNKQHYINSLNIVNCRELTKFEVVECNGVTAIDLPASLVRIFRVTKCPNITTITLKDNPYLNSLEDVTDTETPRRANFIIDACPKLDTLNMSNLNSKDMTWLDLINCESVKHLDISSCGYLDYVRFSSSTSLLTLKADKSGIRRFKIDRNGADVSYLDLGIFPSLNSLALSYCSKLEEIKNINLGTANAPANGGSIFRNCSKLRTISGRIYLNSLNGSFAYCPELVQLPSTIGFNAVSSASEAFRGCSKFPLSEIRRVLNALPNVTTLYYAFAGSTVIESSESSPFPADIFRNQTKLREFRGVFGGCSNLRGPLPIDIFKPLTALVVLQSPFEGCNFEVPILGADTMLVNNVNLEHMYSPFSGIKFIRMPDKRFFEKCTKLKSAHHVFNGQTEMGKATDAGAINFIHPDYFINNEQLTGVRAMFANCRNLIGSIPEGLFRNSKLLEDCYELFEGCSGISGKIPENLFPPYQNSNGAYASKMKYMYRLFKNCPNIHGNIPRSLFENHNAVIQMHEMFMGCSSIGSNLGVGEEPAFPKNFLKGKSSCSTIANMFNGCTELRLSFDQYNQEDISMFNDATNLQDIAQLFMNCSSLDGTLPNDLFNKKDANGDFVPTKINVAYGVFRGCNNLNGRIPKDLFKSWTEVQDLSYFFYYCHNLEGGFPEELFWNCSKLLKLNNFLGFNWDWARKFGTNRDYEVENCLDPETGELLLFSPNLLAYNNRLEDITSFLGFIKGGFVGKIPKAAFRGNPNLKFMSEAFAHASGATLDLDEEFFMNNRYITVMDDMFWASGKMTMTANWISPSIHNQVVRDVNGNVIRKNFGGMFAGHSEMTGTAPALWVMYNDAVSDNGANSGNGGKCFNSCSQLSNFADIPSTWGGV
ncbi:MAG: BspA family leucine-rich repeat surface protein [Sarcina sp.]